MSTKLLITSLSWTFVTELNNLREGPDSGNYGNCQVHTIATVGDPGPTHISWFSPDFSYKLDRDTKSYLTPKCHHLQFEKVCLFIFYFFLYLYGYFENGIYEMSKHSTMGF